MMKSSRRERVVAPEDPASAAMRAPIPKSDQEASDERARVATAGVNRGLRMILVATVVCVAISWAGTVGVQYVKLLMVEELVQTDQDALRVMCAVDPPSEREFNRLHLCEVVATNGVATAASNVAASPQVAPVAAPPPTEATSAAEVEAGGDG